MSFSLVPWEKSTHKTLFPVAHREHSSTEQHSTMTERYSRYRLTAGFLRDPYEVVTRSVRDREFARQGSRARQQGSFLLFPSLLYAFLITSTLQFDSLFYFSTLLFSLLCHSSYWETIPIEFLFKKNRTAAPGSAVFPWFKIIFWDVLLMFYCTPKGTLTALPVIHASFLAVPHTWENLGKTWENQKTLELKDRITPQGNFFQ